MKINKVLAWTAFVLLALGTGIILIRGSSWTPSKPDTNSWEQSDHTGFAEIDLIIDTVLAGTPKDELRLLRFSTLACTHADGLGGPPKCGDNEEEGTKVEVFPFLGPEGHHIRRSEMDEWTGIQASGVYAVYRVSHEVYSDEAYPAGEYAIVFIDRDEPSFITAQVTAGKIVRLDYTYNDPSTIDLTQVASEIILAPQK